MNSNIKCIIGVDAKGNVVSMKGYGKARDFQRPKENDIGFDFV